VAVGEAVDRLSVAGERRAALLVSADIPESDRAVAPTGGDGRAVRTEGESEDAARGLGLDRPADLMPGVDIP
jgi:hypothetical protein